MGFGWGCHGGDIDQFGEFIQRGARLAAVLGGDFFRVRPVGVVDGDEFTVGKLAVDAGVVDAYAAWADDAGANSLHDGIPQRVMLCWVASDWT